MSRGLRKDMTFEEFEALANREPSLDGEWIYRVSQAMLRNVPKHPYPKFELDFPNYCYFKSFHDAEKFVKENKDYVYCSWISQIACGAPGGYGDTGAEWLYDNNGELVDYTITHGVEGKAKDETFFGRPKSRQRFQVGDIVEVVTAKSVHLAVFIQQIPDVEWCWERYSTRDKGEDFFYHLDFSDDSAIVIDGPNYYCHDHIRALDLLTPRFPIPEDILVEMQTWKERCETEDDSDWLKANQPYREDRQKEKGEEVGEFYKLTIYLHFDEETEIPHLHINDHYGLKVALRIDRPEYYDHDDYTDRLTSGQLKSLYSYLTSPNFGKQRWWYKLREWNENNDNPQLNIPLETPVPDYLDLLD